MELSIAQERAAAEAALAVAERLMREQSRDARAFERAKKQRQQALAELDRLKWAEQHQAERAKQAEFEAKHAQLREAQERAARAKEHASIMLEQLQPAVDTLEAVVRQLIAAHREVERGMHYESYGVRDGLIERPTITPGVGVPQDIAVLALRVARELVKLSPLSPALAEMKASQRSL